jgi:hypothetical protein
MQRCSSPLNPIIYTEPWKEFWSRAAPDACLLLPSCSNVDIVLIPLGHALVCMQLWLVGHNNLTRSDTLHPTA